MKLFKKKITTYGRKGIFVRLIYLFISLIYYPFRAFDNSNSIIILCYHGIKNEEKKRFEKQLKIAKSRIVSIKEFFVSQNKHSKALPICITFDDALSNLIVNAIPVINDFRLPITVFIPTGSIGKNPKWLKTGRHHDRCEKVMNESEIYALSKNSLITFGSHTVDHPQLSSLAKSGIKKQLNLSQKIIKEIVGYQITELALPHGDYNDEVISIAKEEGYNIIYTLEEEINKISRNNNFLILGRFLVSPKDWIVEYYLTINGAYAWLYYFRKGIRKIINKNNWKKLFLPH